TGEYKSPEANTLLVADPEAGPLWGRFYDLENCEIYVCDRDGIPRKSLEEIGRERRNGYSWYNNYPAYLYEPYDKWADRYDPSGKVSISPKKL
ncbi:MAG: pectate lyase, partial [Muribaculaceae bacterium]|nr:pectate lyase [Muribaculaceae bacterium]